MSLAPARPPSFRFKFLVMQNTHSKRRKVRINITKNEHVPLITELANKRGCIVQNVEGAPQTKKI